jgi:hypothetical protein
VEQLKEQEFQVVYAGRAREKTETTKIEGRGRHPDAARRVAQVLEAGTPQWETDKEGAMVTVVVGGDQLLRAQASEPF